MDRDIFMSHACMAFDAYEDDLERGAVSFRHWHRGYDFADGSRLYFEIRSSNERG